MRIIRHVRTTPQDLKRAVVAIGNFDGVHRGHQGIIGKARQLAEASDCHTAVLTFEPHPRSVFQPDNPPFRLTPFRVKARLIQSLGVDALFALPFNRALSSLEPDAFIEKVLVDGIRCGHVVVGDNFRFGRKRAGNIETLKAGGDKHGFGVTALTRMKSLGAEAYSSTGVRSYLSGGAPSQAAMLLGRYYEVVGRVHHNDGVLTLAPEAINLPAQGVYAVRVTVDETGGWAGAMAELLHIQGTPHPTCRFSILPIEQGPDIAGQAVRIAMIERLGNLSEAIPDQSLNHRLSEHRDAAMGVLTSEDWTSSWPASPILAGPHT